MEPKHIHNDEEEEKKVIKRINKKMSGFIIKGHSKNVDYVEIPVNNNLTYREIQQMAINEYSMIVEEIIDIAAKIGGAFLVKRNNWLEINTFLYNLRLFEKMINKILSKMKENKLKIKYTKKLKKKSSKHSSFKEQEENSLGTINFEKKRRLSYESKTKSVSIPSKSREYSLQPKQIHQRIFFTQELHFNSQSKQLSVSSNSTQENGPLSNLYNENQFISSEKPNELNLLSIHKDGSEKEGIKTDEQMTIHCRIQKLIEEMNHKFQQEREETNKKFQREHQEREEMSKKFQQERAEMSTKIEKLEKRISDIERWKNACIMRKRINEILRLIIVNFKNNMYLYPKNNEEWMGFTEEFNSLLGFDGDDILDNLFKKRDESSKIIHFDIIKREKTNKGETNNDDTLIESIEEILSAINIKNLQGIINKCKDPPSKLYLGYTDEKLYYLYKQHITNKRPNKYPRIKY